jgi:hypothetical protein
MTKVDKKLLVVLYPFRSIAAWVATAVPTGSGIFKAYSVRGRSGAVSII